MILLQSEKILSENECSCFLSSASISIKFKILTNYLSSFFAGKYRDMIVTFTFSRRIGYYLINFYVPCIIMVIMSWISFWIDRDCIGDRIALGITTVLTIVFLLGSSNSTMPRVSYPKAIDWYLMTSFIFVFVTLLMCLLIFRFDRQLKRQQPTRSVSYDAQNDAATLQVIRGWVGGGVSFVCTCLFSNQGFAFFFTIRCLMNQRHVAFRITLLIHKAPCIPSFEAYLVSSEEISLSKAFPRVFAVCPWTSLETT